MPQQQSPIGSLPGLQRRLGLPSGVGGIGAGVVAGGTGRSGALAIPAAAGGTNAGYLMAPLSEAPPAALHMAASQAWVRRIVDTVNNTLRGKLNVTLEITLTPSVTTTILTDARISALSYLEFMPLTQGAAQEKAAGTMYVSDQRAGQATITHSGSAAIHRTFRVVIFG